ncbi:hypothetical protein EJ05DRAFT_495880 [Pseudovirgaria hyperparasitica]|uniref:Uncharacterized protein n=1 Tax=Pseudovirgaria hyperparasitica TaxID=470096 RepID=A0A6A6WLZ3_9PEZI|nr:uncharacterized protein EJ05DRAFT_495880 [Pseudovirgaria hyperparasitica]KAF2763039.1 hypothetical protein EJ05DRAFT_495880 [Pseudovirgaria hyperparasitica]
MPSPLSPELRGQSLPQISQSETTAQMTLADSETYFSSSIGQNPALKRNSMMRQKSNLSIDSRDSDISIPSGRKSALSMESRDSEKSTVRPSRRKSVMAIVLGLRDTEAREFRSLSETKPEENNLEVVSEFPQIVVADVNDTDTSQEYDLMTPTVGFQNPFWEDPISKSHLAPDKNMLAPIPSQVSLGSVGTTASSASSIVRGIRHVLPQFSATETPPKPRRRSTFERVKRELFPQLPSKPVLAAKRHKATSPSGMSRSQHIRQVNHEAELCKSEKISTEDRPSDEELRLRNEIMGSSPFNDNLNVAEEQNKGDSPEQKHTFVIPIPEAALPTEASTATKMSESKLRWPMKIDLSELKPITFGLVPTPTKPQPPSNLSLQMPALESISETPQIIFDSGLFTPAGFSDKTQSQHLRSVSRDSMRHTRRRKPTPNSEESSLIGSPTPLSAVQPKSGHRPTVKAWLPMMSPQRGVKRPQSSESLFPKSASPLPLASFHNAGRPVRRSSVSAGATVSMLKPPGIERRSSTSTPSMNPKKAWNVSSPEQCDNTQASSNPFSHIWKPYLPERRCSTSAPSLDTKAVWDVSKAGLSDNTQVSSDQCAQTWKPHVPEAHSGKSTTSIETKVSTASLKSKSKLQPIPDNDGADGLEEALTRQEHKVDVPGVLMRSKSNTRPQLPLKLWRAFGSSQQRTRPDSEATSPATKVSIEPGDATDIRSSLGTGRRKTSYFSMERSRSEAQTAKVSLAAQKNLATKSKVMSQYLGDRYPAESTSHWNSDDLLMSQDEIPRKSGEVRPLLPARSVPKDGVHWFRVRLDSKEDDDEEGMEEEDSTGPMRQHEWDLPEHLPGSPLCPLSPKHKSGGKGYCPMHSRRKTHII